MPQSEIVYLLRRTQIQHMTLLRPTIFAFTTGYSSMTAIVCQSMRDATAMVIFFVFCEDAKSSFPHVTRLIWLNSREGRNWCQWRELYRSLHLYINRYRYFASQQSTPASSCQLIPKSKLFPRTFKGFCGIENMDRGTKIIYLFILLVLIYCIQYYNCIKNYGNFFRSVFLGTSNGSVHSWQFTCTTRYELIGGKDLKWFLTLAGCLSFSRTMYTRFHGWENSEYDLLLSPVAYLTILLLTTACTMM